MDINKLKEQLISDPEVRHQIGRRSYEIYLERQKQGRGGHPAEDWLRAEAEVLPALIDEIIEKNRKVVEAHDESDPVMKRAAEHMTEVADDKPAKKKASPRKTPAKADVKAPVKKAAAKLKKTEEKSTAKKSTPKTSGAKKTTDTKKAPKTAKTPAKKVATKKKS